MNKLLLGLIAAGLTSGIGTAAACELGTDAGLGAPPVAATKVAPDPATKAMSVTAAKQASVATTTRTATKSPDEAKGKPATMTAKAM
jgi:hypothetical protein